MLPIEELLETHDYVFIDTSIRDSDVARATYDAKRFEDLDMMAVMQDIKCAETLLAIMDNDSIATIPEVSEEFRAYEGIISKKLRRCNLSLQDFPHSSREREMRIRNDMANLDPNRQALTALQEYSFEIYRASKSHEVNFESPEYDTLYEMINLLDSTLRIRKVHNDEREPWSDTDLKLVASLYYASMTARNPPCLVAADSDFMPLFKDTTRFMASEAFMPYNQRLRESLIDNEYRLFFPTGIKEGRCYVSKISHNPVFLPDFTMSVAGYDLRQGLLELWQKFPQSPTND